MKITDNLDKRLIERHFLVLLSDTVPNTSTQKQVKTAYSTSVRLKVKVALITASEHERHRT